MTAGALRCLRRSPEARLAALGMIATALYLGTACAEPRAPSIERRVGALPGDTPPLDALSRRNGRLRDRLAHRGYEVMDRQARVFLLESHGVVIPLALDASRCHTFVALGSTGLRALHAILYDEDGVEVASDAIPREGALVHACPDGDEEPRVRHYLVLSSSAGSGSVAVTEAESSPGAGEGFEGLFDAILAPHVPVGDVEQALGRTRTALRARGFTLAGDPDIETLSDRGSARTVLRVEAGRCYVIVARGGEGIEDLDLYLFDGSGAEIGRDLSHGAEALLEHCASESADYVVVARPYRGSGAVGVALFAGPRGPSPPSSAESRDLDEVFGPAHRADAPDLQLAVAVADLVEQGFDEPVFIVRSAIISPREVLSHDVVVGPGCALVTAVGSGEAMDLDLYLADPSGRELDSDTDTRSFATVRACAPSATVLRVAVKVYGREGTYTLASLRAPRGVDDVLSLRLSELTAESRARGYELSQTDSFDLSEGEVRIGELRLAPGRCVVVALAGESELRDVDLVLRGADERVLAADRGPAPHAISGYCAPPELSEAVVVRWEAHAYRGSGGVRAEVLQGAP